jgi:hypothetical protein
VTSALLLALALLTPPARPARASSEANPLGEGRHAAHLAVDGNSATAWCEGAPGLGVGEWLEVRPPCPRGKGVCRIELENGWGKNEAIFRQRGRVLRLRISSCLSSDDGMVVEVKDQLDPQEFTLREPLPAPACVRLTILQATAGKVQDTCLSEVRASCACEP